MPTLGYGGRGDDSSREGHSGNSPTHSRSSKGRKVAEESKSLGVDVKPALSTPKPKSRNQPARHAISLRLRLQILERDGRRCRICGASPLTDPQVHLQIDHITPINLGGTNDPHNLQVLCDKCNWGKSNYLSLH